MRRRAAMTRATPELWLLSSRVDKADGDDARAPPLDEDGDVAADESEDEETPAGEEAS